MKIAHNLTLACLTMLVMQAGLNAQLYTFTNDELGAPGTVATGITASNLVGVNGVTYINACGSGYVTDTWSTSAGPFSTTFSAVQLTLTPVSGYEVTVTSLQFDFGRNPQGPQKIRFAYSLNGGASWTNSGTDLTVVSGPCGSASTFSWNMADFTTTNQILIRIIGWAAGNVNGQARTYNGIVNGSACALQTWYADGDGDTYGDAASTTMACSAPVGYVADNTDCDDSEAGVYPGAAEICDGLDNDCNGETDENLVTALISPVGSALTCKGDPFTFSVEPCAGCTYQWFKNDNVIAGATSTTYSTTKPAYYNVEVTVPGGCTDASDYTLLTVSLNPNANIYYPNGLNLCAPSPGTNIIVKVGYTATNTYQWYKDGLPYAGMGATDFRILPTEPGDYRCSITSESGCNRITDVATVINSCRTENIISTDLSIYPNPADQFCHIEGTLSTEINQAQVKLYDITGKIALNQNIPLQQGAFNIELDTHTLTGGLYIIQIEAVDAMQTSTLVIE